MKKGYISESMGSNRISSHGKITSLASGFRLDSGNSFSVYIEKKDTSQIDNDTNVILSVRCYQDDACSDVPINLNDWTPLAIVEIDSYQSLLDDYDIYWGSGQYEG